MGLLRLRAKYCWNWSSCHRTTASATMTTFWRRSKAAGTASRRRWASTTTGSSHGFGCRMRWSRAAKCGYGSSGWCMAWLDVLALWIGRWVLISCGIGGAAAISFYPINYAWRRWGDTVALHSFMIEARRQGRTIFREKNGREYG